MSVSLAAPASIQARVTAETSASALSRLVISGTDAVALVTAIAFVGLNGIGGLLLSVATLAALPFTYRPSRVTWSLASDLPRVAIAVASSTALAAFAYTLTGTDPSGVLRGAPPLLLALVVGRAASYNLVTLLRSRGAVSERVLVIGDSDTARTIAETLVEHEDYGLVPLGFVGRTDDTGIPDVPVRGEVEDLPDLVKSLDVDRLLVATTDDDHDTAVVIRRCLETGLAVDVVPRLYDLGCPSSPRERDDLRGIPLLHVRSAPQRRPAWAAKQLADATVAGVALIALSPVLALLALSVRMSSPGPILYRQERIGLNGRRFQLLKFRSMRVNGDGGTTWSVDHDPRITPIGRILRATSLDELPQLFNVLKGDMSLVGPRPERPHFVEAFGETYRGYPERHRVPPGMTGWSQVNGLRGDTSIAERARYDNRYIDDWTLWRDLVIVARTVTAVLRDAWAEIRKLSAARRSTQHAALGELRQVAAGEPARAATEEVLER